MFELPITFWYPNGSSKTVRTEDRSDVPQKDDRIVSPDGSIVVVTERWEAPLDHDYEGVHIVLREPGTPSERTPPWERGKDDAR